MYYDNSLYDYINEFNEKNQLWRRIYGGNSLIFKDFEYLLRFLSLNYYSEIKSTKFSINYKKTFSYSNIIDDFSAMFNSKPLKNSSQQQSEEEVNKIMNYNAQIKANAKEQLMKLEKFFGIFYDDFKDEQPNGKISLLILEAVFLSFSKLGLLDSGLKLDFVSFFNTLNQTDFKISKSTSNRGTIEKRINKAINIIRKEFPKNESEGREKKINC